MSELDSYAKAIAKKLKPAMSKAEEPKAQRDIFGTVRAVGSGGDISYEVMLDGSASYTPCTPTVEVHAGDRVVCHIVNHRVIAFSNLTVPSVNDQGYQHVKDIATEANELLDGVSAAAASADKTVAEILADSVTANGLVSEIETYVGYAEGYTQTLADSVQAASGAAAEADRKAVAAGAAAGAAQSSADEANLYANSALGQLSVVQDVVGVLSWASEHGSFQITSDASVREGKVYFTYDVESGDFLPVVDPQEPDMRSYYELTVDEAMNDFIMAHLAVTNRGLWVLPGGVSFAQRNIVDSDGNAIVAVVGEPQESAGYKMLLANDGSYIYDGSGVLVRSDTTSGTDFAEGRSFHFGSDDAYILYTPASGSTPASMVIGGANVQLGSSKTLSQVLSELASALQPSDVVVTQNATQTGYDVTIGTNTFSLVNGADGTSVTILGSYADYASLVSAHPTGSLGDGYMVAGDLYVWNGSSWEDVGTIQGPKGDTGTPGPQGPQGPAGTTGARGPVGPEAFVVVRATSVNWKSYTAVLAADLYVDGVLVDPSDIDSWQWAKDGYEIAGAAARTYSVYGASNMDALYSCTLEWS